MLKYIIIIILFSSGITYGQEEIIENDSIILWQANRPLKWDDFKGKQLNYHGNVLAETHGKIKTIDVSWVNEIPVFKVRCYFLKFKSWTITKDSISLEHEQIHFNIYELISRKIRKAFHKLNSKGVKDVKEYEKIFNKLIQIKNEYNELYDIDVVTNKEKQQEWKIKIIKELGVLKEYESIRE